VIPGLTALSLNPSAMADLKETNNKIEKLLSERKTKLSLP
jgi:hypothetical protein